MGIVHHAGREERDLHRSFCRGAAATLARQAAVGSNVPHLAGLALYNRHLVCDPLGPFLNRDRIDER